MYNRQALHPAFLRSVPGAGGARPARTEESVLCALCPVSFRGLSGDGHRVSLQLDVYKRQGKHYTLAGSGDKTCGYFETDAQSYEKDADDAEKPLLKIVCESDSLNQRSAGVDQQSEYNYGGKLQKLKPLISVSQNGNLNQHEKGVDDYGGCADGQAGDTAGDIGKAGNRDVYKRQEYTYNGYKFCLEAEVDAVQMHNAEDAIKSAWGVDVTVSDDGRAITLN